MGTNFYVRGFINSDDPSTHIGKRSAAGLYCWDCNLTLCMDGLSGIHMGKSAWYKTCAGCGKGARQESLETSSAGRELGFNQTQPSRKVGIAGCSSFGWCIEPSSLAAVVSQAEKCPHCEEPFKNKEKVIEDEYGRLYSLEEFEEMLLECPIQSTDMIGKYFC